MAFWSIWHDGDTRDGDVGDVGPYPSSVLNALRAGGVLLNEAMGPYLANDSLGGFSCSGAVAPLTLTSGLGHVNGRLILSDASSTIAVPTPAASTRMDILCLQYDAATNQVRPYLHQGVEGAGVYPSLTQTAITWEVPLWGVTITTLGAITLADLRVYVQPAVRISDSQIAAGTISRSKLVALDQYKLILPYLSWNVTDGIAIPLEYTSLGWPLLDNKICKAFAKMHVPADWDGVNPILVYPVVMIPSGSGNIYGYVGAQWGSGGQAYDAHDASNSNAAEAIAAAETLTGLTPVTLPAADLSYADIISMYYTRTGNDALDTLGVKAYLCGFDVRYTGK